MVFVDREVDQAVQGITQVQAKLAEQLTKLAAMMLERMNEAKELGEALDPQEQQVVDKLIAQHCINTLDQYGTEAVDGQVRFESERYILSYQPDDATGMTVYSVYDRETDSECLSFQRHPASGEFVYFEVETPLTDDQKRDFVKALAQQSELEASRDRSPVEQVKTQMDIYGELAPRGCKAVIVADAILNSQPSDRVVGADYVLQREQEGGLNIFRADSNEQILNFSSDGRIQEWMQTADVIRFGQVFSTFQKSQEQQIVSSVSNKSANSKAGVELER